MCKDTQTPPCTAGDLVTDPPPCPHLCPSQKGEHYHLDDGQDAINNIYACGLLEEINIEPEQDPTDPTKINIKLVVEEVQPKSVEVRARGDCDGHGCMRQGSRAGDMGRAPDGGHWELAAGTGSSSSRVHALAPAVMVPYTESISTAVSSQLVHASTSSSPVQHAGSKAQAPAALPAC